MMGDPWLSECCSNFECVVCSSNHDLIGVDTVLIATEVLVVQTLSLDLLLHSNLSYPDSLGPRGVRN